MHLTQIVKFFVTIKKTVRHLNYLKYVKIHTDTLFDLLTCTRNCRIVILKTFNRLTSLLKFPCASDGQ